MSWESQGAKGGGVSSEERNLKTRRELGYMSSRRLVRVGSKEQISVRMFYMTSWYFDITISTWLLLSPQQQIEFRGI